MDSTEAAKLKALSGPQGIQTKTAESDAAKPPGDVEQVSSAERVSPKGKDFIFNTQAVAFVPQPALLPTPSAPSKAAAPPAKTPAQLLKEQVVARLSPAQRMRAQVEAAIAESAPAMKAPVTPASSSSKAAPGGFTGAGKQGTAAGNIYGDVSLASKAHGAQTKHWESGPRGTAQETVFFKRSALPPAPRRPPPELPPKQAWVPPHPSVL